MPTGACGINCDVCKLRLLNLCSTCGPGKSKEAAGKLEAQQRIFGITCSILACAKMNRVDYCMRDCDQFPCDNFHVGPCPFSTGFLSMQERRRRQRPPALDHNGRPISVPKEYWKRLKEKDLLTLTNVTLFRPISSNCLLFEHFNKEIMIDMNNDCLRFYVGDEWRRLDDPLLELVTLLYLNSACKVEPLGKRIIGIGELKQFSYFKGKHELPLGSLLERYENDMEGFKNSARYLGAKKINMGDAGFVFFPFPRIPVYYLFWEGDGEFKSSITVLFERSIEAYFSASGIWALVSLVCNALLMGPSYWEVSA